MRILVMWEVYPISGIQSTQEGVRVKLRRNPSRDSGSTHLSAMRRGVLNAAKIEPPQPTFLSFLSTACSEFAHGPGHSVISRLC